MANTQDMLVAAAKSAKQTLASASDAARSACCAGVARGVGSGWIMLTNEGENH
jgi:hypothetical protein